MFEERQKKFSTGDSMMEVKSLGNLGINWIQFNNSLFLYLGFYSFQNFTTTVLDTYSVIV